MATNTPIPVNRELNGVLFNNQHKRGENDPDLKGFATIDGKEYTVSGWKKTNTNGQYHKLSFRPKVVTPVIHEE